MLKPNDMLRADVDEQSSEPTWCRAILTGPYLKKTMVRVQLDGYGRILDCDRIHSVYSRTPNFDKWFRDLYNPFVERTFVVKR